MKYLLDVNLLIADVVQTHSQHARVRNWLAGKQVVLCPIVELGFLRISTHSRAAIGLTMTDARDRLEKFGQQRGAERIPDDLPALASQAQTSDQVTDHYLANLAAKHGLRLATLDVRIHHSAIELVS